MKSYKKFLTGTVLLLAVVSLATASAVDMTIFPKESTTRIDSFTSYEVQLENVGPVEDYYHLSSNRPGEITIAPLRAPEEGTLAPGETKTVNVWYNPNIDREEGRYSFDITATSQASGDKYSVKGFANVVKDHKVNLQPDQTSKTGCVGETTTFEIDVTNDGIQKEGFELRTDEGELSQTEVKLENGETRTVVLEISDDEEVEKNFNVVASSKTSYAQDIINLNFNTETCYNSEVSITPEEQDVAAFTEAEYDVTVSNTGTRSDLFVLSSNVGQFGETELDIEGLGSGSTTLTVNPEELGTQEVQVSADSRVASTDTAQLNVYNGMDLNIGFGPEEIRVCEQEQTTTTLQVENTGEAAETYSLETEDGVLSQEELELDVGEVGYIDLDLNSTEYGVGTHDIEVTGTAGTFGEPSETATTSLVVENCWDLEMNIVPEVASAGENRSTVYKIDLENTGTKENTYDISHNGPNWIDIRPSQITVQPGEEENSYMYAGVPFQKEGELDITVTGVGTDVERSKTVKLVIGEELEEAIRDDAGGTGITGAFTRGASDIVERVAGTDLSRAVISILVGLAITAAILYREW